MRGAGSRRVSARAMRAVRRSNRCRWGRPGTRARRAGQPGTIRRFRPLSRPVMTAATERLFGAVELAPRDPILGVTETFVADPNPRKVNLGVGVYCDDNGKVPVLDCVRKAEREIVEAGLPRTYLPIDGIAAYDKAAQQ